VVLELVSAGADEIVYDAALHTPAACHRARVRVDAGAGTIAFGPWDTPAPPWLVELAHAFLRAEWRARRGPDPAPWPARVNRWREEKTGRS
jgi:hypothetical protein